MAWQSKEQLLDKETVKDLNREALWTFPREWRVMYFGFFVLLNIAFVVLGVVEFRSVGHWIDAPFTSLTAIVVGSGTAAALLSLFLTEIWRLIVTFSTWVAEKLEENLERSRERRRKEREWELEMARKREWTERQWESKMARERKQVLERERMDVYEAGRKAGLLEAQGKQPPPPPWETNGSNGSN